MKNTSIFKDLRSFLLLWGSQTVSELGTAMTNYALIIWVYGQRGTASSVTLLTLCAFLPTIFFRFIGGTLADRWDKKRIMLVCDLIAACGTLTVLTLYSLSALRVWHIYLINALLSLMNAAQQPASFAATSLLVPREHYTRVGGLQGFSGAAVSILAPALGGCLLAWGGMEWVLLCDLASFGVAFAVLLCCIRFPEAERVENAAREPFLRSCLDGLRWLWEHKGLLQLTLFIAAVNLLAKLGDDGMLSPFVLGRTGGDERVLGFAQSAVALGLMAGSLAMTLAKPAKNKVKRVFLSTALVCCGGVVLGLSREPAVWCAAEFGSYAMAAVMNAYLMAVMREQVPQGMQGRVFAAKGTLQNCTIPLGLLLAGALADGVFEPMMASPPPVLGAVFGSGAGAGIAVMFVLTGCAGIALSLGCLRLKAARMLDK